MLSHGNQQRVQQAAALVFAPEILILLWIEVLSFLPPLAPILMPARLALGVLAWWEMPVAVLIMLIAVYGMVRLAARIYAPALVRGGARARVGARRCDCGRNDTVATTGMTI